MDYSYYIDIDSMLFSFGIGQGVVALVIIGELHLWTLSFQRRATYLRVTFVLLPTIITPTVNNLMFSTSCPIVWTDEGQQIYLIFIYFAFVMSSYLMWFYLLNFEGQNIPLPQLMVLYLQSTAVMTITAVFNSGLSASFALNNRIHRYTEP